MLLRTVTIVLPAPNFVNRLFAVLLCSSAGLVAGASFAFAHAQIVRRSKTDYPKTRIWIGVGVMIGFIAYLVARNPVVDATDWRLWLFTAAAMFAASGAVELLWRAFSHWLGARKTGLVGRSHDRR